MSEFGPNGKSESEIGQPKLLLADDSATIRKVVELTFADEGIVVTAVADGASAMKQFIEMRPDIVLVDTNLPGTSGYQICEMIKQDEATAHIPVVLLVGSFEPFDHDEAERVAADGFLTKPFNSIRELINRVKELLEPPSAQEITLEEIQIEPGESQRPAMDNVYRMSDFSETKDIENLYERSFVDTAEIQEFETVDDLLSDPALDDELIDASYHRDTGFVASLPDMDLTARQGTSKDFEWSLTSLDRSEGSDEMDPGPSSDADRPSFNETLIEAPAAQANDQVLNVTAEPTNEFIALVAEKVVERLSERAIRDVAKEVVPRIAEKLIREALAEEKKA